MSWLLVTGSRYAGVDTPRGLVTQAKNLIAEVLTIPELDLVLHGGAPGVDTWVGQEAARLGVPTRVFKAEWDVYGKRAGFIRNTEMMEELDAHDDIDDGVLAIWDGESKGTRHTIGLALDHGIDLHVKVIR